MRNWTYHSAARYTWYTWREGIWAFTLKMKKKKNFVLAFLQQNCSVLWFFWLRLRTEDQSLRTEDGPTPTENTLAEFLVLINSVGPRQPLASLPCHRLWHPFNVWLRNNLSIFHQYFPVFKPWYSTICCGLAQFASKAMDILSYALSVFYAKHEIKLEQIALERSASKSWSWFSSINAWAASVHQQHQQHQRISAFAATAH